ncbi:PRS6A [Hepatospora eriocheir]|uniref:PRS6A n=1 Tax=Hepatospora eriocheir TaxID=1081669 RepID=A0A1X0QEI6_9MICR|nr:PRS6A [Hepatospora eriocheir]
MAVDDAVNFDDLAKSTEGFNGAQCKAVCTEAGMSAVRLKKTIISQGDFINGINEVLSRKKSNLIYFT